MVELLLNPQTAQQLAAFQAKPGHALLIIGPAGSGKLALARQLATQLIGNSPHLRTVEPENGKSISIEAIRSLEHFLSLKVPGKAAVDRVVIIADSHLMTPEAQNALLKTLEEPPVGTLLLLTAAQEQALLPTIRSRLQVLNVKRPGQAASRNYFSPAAKAEAIDQAYAISGGWPGLMSSLLNDDEHPLTQAVDMARQLLSRPPFERLLLVDELARDRQLASQTLFILQQMAHISLKKADGPAAKRWQQVLAASYQAADQLANSVQPKLCLTNLMLQF